MSPRTVTLIWIVLTASVCFVAGYLLGFKHSEYMAARGDLEVALWTDTVLGGPDHAKARAENDILVRRAYAYLSRQPGWKKLLHPDRLRDPEPEILARAAALKGALDRASIPITEGEAETFVRTYAGTHAPPRKPRSAPPASP